jgi:hypothetical protein
MKSSSKQMKRIKICGQNEPKIGAELIRVNGNATAHTYTAYSQIEYLAGRAEKSLSRLLNKKDFSGAVYIDCSGDAVANCYKYSRTATLVTLTRGSKDWYLTSVKSQDIYCQGPAARFSDQLILTPEQDKAAVSLLRRKYQIADAPGPESSVIAQSTLASNDEFAKCAA